MKERKTKHHNPICSFCGHTADECLVMIANPAGCRRRVYICDMCAFIALRLVTDYAETRMPESANHARMYLAECKRGDVKEGQE